MNEPRPSNGRLGWKSAYELVSERDFCQWVNPYLFWRSPLGVLAFAAVSALLCGLFVAPQGFVVLAAIAAVIAIGCVWPWIGIRGVSCQLRFATTRTDEGKPAEAELIITNRWPWPVWGLAVEGGFALPTDEHPRAATAIARIGGWSRSYFHWEFVPELRGRYPSECPQLVTEFPFGLWKARRRVEVISSLIVWPARFQLPPIALPCGAQTWTGQPNECAAGNLGHRTSVREYRVGDSMRQIHWAKTALYDKLVSYEREGVAVTEAFVALDTPPSMHCRIGRDSSAEWPVRIAASICETLLRQSVSVTVVAQESNLRMQANPNSLATLMDWFAQLNVADDSNQPAKRASPIRQTGLLTIHVATELSQNVDYDSIVLLTHPEERQEASTALQSRNWMTVECGADIPAQVRRGWQHGPRRRRHAV